YFTNLLSGGQVLVALGSGKYVAATKSLYNSIIGNQNAADTEEGTSADAAPKTLHSLGRIRLPPDPDPYQYEIINHRGASIVIGRSGTGKTTALIYKMRAIYQCAPSFRQMFVTRSRVLARHVESSFGRLIDSINMESEVAEELGEKPKDLDQALVEFDNEVDLRTDLPSRFSLLNESHFPLFISFDKLCSLIEADIYEEQRGKKREVWSARPMWERKVIGFRSHYILEKFKEKAPHQWSDAASSQLPDEPSHQSSDEAYQLDYLYVDEVQDNLMTDIRMLRRLCGSIDNTYWGGDTAQTIVAGSAFRIKDLGSYIHNEAHDTSGGNWKGFPSRLPPSQFELTVNYRSHEGLVRCAASVVDSLYDLFPESLDRLPRETADDKSVDCLPVILTDTSSNISLFEEFLLNPNSSLGVQQAVLVKSEEIAEQLSARVSEFCPILTIADSKGLEFHDIILYNFFSESDCAEAWDFVHGFPMKTHRNERDSIPPLSLCNELKLLYVALTRAQKRCWIWDHGYVIDAMKKFWKAQGLVTTASIADIITSGSGQNASNSAPWIAKGQEYFANGMYKLAAGCFRRGGDEAASSYRIAMAYYQMSRAKIEMLRGDTEESRSKLRNASMELHNCAEQAQGQSARHLWFHTAICLELLHDILGSADAFVNAELYERAIRTLLDRSYVKRTVKILLKHGHKLESRTREEFLDYCRKYYFEKYALEELSPLFDSIEDQLSYARKYGYWDQLKQLLELHKQFDELARLHLDQRAIAKGLDWFLHAYNHHKKASSLNEAAKVVIRYAEWTLPLEGKRSPRALEQLGVMMDKVITHQDRIHSAPRKALKLYQTIRKSGVKSIMIDDWNKVDPEESVRVAWILHTLIQDTDWSTNRLLGGIIARLNEWGNYNRHEIVSKILQASEPSKIVAAQRLFGFKPASSELYASPYYIVAEGSLVAESAHKYSFTTQRNSYHELLVPARWVDKIMKDEFRARLHDRLRKIYSGLIRSGWTSSPAFNPQAVQPSGFSRPLVCAVTDRAFKNRFNVVNVAIEALAPVCHIPFGAKSSLTDPGLVQLWVRRLFDVVYPITGVFEEIPDSRVCGGQPSYPGVRAFVQQYLIEAPFSCTDMSAHVIASSLSIQLGSPMAKYDAFRSTCDVSSSSENERIVDSFFNRENPSGLTVAVLGLRNKLTSSRGPLDAVVTVHLIEMITCEFLYHTRAFDSRSHDGFSGLILPYSWAMMLAKRYAHSHVARHASSLDTLLDVLAIISDQLESSQGLGRWWVAQELLSNRRDVAHILQLRLCWCISLLLVNAQIVAPLGCGGTSLCSSLHIARHSPQQGHEPLYRRYGPAFVQQSYQVDD
ncbi:unnamed protein product, partial [Rhizoctonia solani]